MRAVIRMQLVYWLARMIRSGAKTVQFIARRMLILASEDIGPMRIPNATAARAMQLLMP